MQVIVKEGFDLSSSGVISGKTYDVCDVDFVKIGKKQNKLYKLYGINGVFDFFDSSYFHVLETLEKGVSVIQYQGLDNDGTEWTIYEKQGMVVGVLGYRSAEESMKDFEVIEEGSEWNDLVTIPWEALDSRGMINSENLEFVRSFLIE